MFEKVNPCHPDKVADRIAGALVDAAYRKEENPRIAVEGLIGHGVCHIIAESSVHISLDEVDAIVKRIAGDLHTDYSVFDESGKVVYTGKQSGAGSSTGSFLVQVTATDLNIRKGPGTNYAKTGKYTGKGVFTITEVKSGTGSVAGWGKLKSGVGWISLDYCKRL